MKHHPNTFLELALRAEPLVRVNLSADPRLTTRELLGRDGSKLVFSQCRKTHEEWRCMFWGRVSIRGIDDCWLWPRRKSNGYANVWHLGRYLHAHRVAFMLANDCGILPETTFVCHHCDNAQCCNPNHLFPGTAKDNNLDRARKGRSVPTRGTISGMAKLTEAAVMDIRSNYKKYKHGKYADQMATKYGVAACTVREIIYKSWLHWPHVQVG